MIVGTWGPEFFKSLVHMQRKPLNCPRLLGQFWGLPCAGYSPVSFSQQVEGALEMRPGGVLVAQGFFVIPWTVACQALCPWDSPGKNTGVGCHSLLQGIFPSQESNPSLLHCRWIIYRLSH